MRYHIVSVFPVLAAVPLASLAKPFSPHWGNVYTKDSGNTVLEYWGSLGFSHDDIRIDLYVALKPSREGDLIGVL